MNIINFKQQAAELAADDITSGMIVGLGHGSTAIFAIRRLAALLQDGTLHDVLGIPCSRQVEQDATALGIPLTTLDLHPVIDLTIDGADEVAPNLDIIKGGGGALLREKIVAQASTREIIVVDAGKLSSALGTRFRVPVEVIPFAWHAQVRFLESLGAQVFPRQQPDGSLFVTDQGNYILDSDFGAVADPSPLAVTLQARAGIVEHGYFLGIASEVIVAGEEGIRRLRRASE